jgi:hypothetical protein
MTSEEVKMTKPASHPIAQALLARGSCRSPARSMPTPASRKPAKRWKTRSVQSVNQEQLPVALNEQVLLLAEGGGQAAQHVRADARHAIDAG